MSNWEEDFKFRDSGFGFFLKSLKNFWALLGQEKRVMIWVLFWLTVTQFLGISFPFLLKLIFDDLPQILKTKEISGHLIWLIVTMFVLRIGGIALHQFVKETLFIKSLVRLENSWPVQAQSKLLSLSFGYHERENTGKKISKIEKGVDRLVEISMNLSWGILPQLIYLLTNLCLMLIMDWRLGIIFLLPIGPVLWINKLFYERFSEGWELWEKKKEESSGYFTQSLLNIKTVQDYVQEEREKNRLAQVRESMTVLDTEINMKERYYFLAIRGTLNFFFLLTIAVGLFLVLKDETKIGTLVFIITTGNMTIENISELFNNYARMLRHLVSVNRMKEILDAEQTITNPEQPKIPEAVSPTLRFEGVEFHYPGKEQAVLQEFDLEIKPRQMVALVGRSGEGKSTVAKLLCRVYDVDAGKVTLSGIDIRDLDRSWYRRHFAIVQQDVDIFDTTLLENITYAYPESTPDQVEEALRAAHVQNMLAKKERFPEGLMTKVGERGIRLSGGERQRVGIARAYIALLNGAKFLVLDEATSSLDSETEVAIQAMLNTIRKRMDISIIAIAHRLSTIRKADMIYVVNEGRVAEAGNHERLLAQNGLYSRLVELQKLGELRR